jgi:hypothetical protein
MVKPTKQHSILWGGWSTLAKSSGVDVVNLKPEDSRWAELGATFPRHPDLDPHAASVTNAQKGNKVRGYWVSVPRRPSDV